MDTLWYTLAQSLAPDYLWPVLLLLAVLAIMGGLRAVGVRINGWQRTGHFVRGLREKQHRPKSHGHQ